MCVCSIILIDYYFFIYVSSMNGNPDKDCCILFLAIKIDVSKFFFLMLTNHIIRDYIGLISIKYALILSVGETPVSI